MEVSYVLTVYFLDTDPVIVENDVSAMFLDASEIIISCYMRFNAVHSAVANAATSTYAYLPIVEILVNSRYPVFALLESGSTNTIMSEQLATKFPPSDKRVRFEMQNINLWSDKGYQMMSVNVSCLDGSNVEHFRDVLVDGEMPYARPDKEIDLSICTDSA